MSRSIPEWIAKHDDQTVPPRVRLRIFDRFNGICQLSGRKIKPGEAWELNHIKELIAGGQHRENNLEPVLKEPHKQETKRQMAVKAKVDRTRKKHIGVSGSKKKLQSRNTFAGSGKRKRHPIDAPPPKRLFTPMD